MNRYEAFIESSWRDSGIAHLVVARIRTDGRADIGVFLTDVWCLGVKDAFLLEGGSETALRELVEERLPETYRERFHPACAKKLIEGAIAYAEQLGFAPHRDYRKARRALTGLDASACPEIFTFGRDGKPCYVEGPNDTPERTERVLAILEARCGEGGFEYMLAEEDDEGDVDDARGALQMFFDDEPESSPTFYEFSGLLTALQICPTVVSPNQVLEKFWGPDGRTWQDEEELKDFLDDVRVYWNYLADLVAGCASAAPDDADAYPLDVFEEDFDEPALMADGVVLWCRGFMRATTEWPEAWGNSLTRAELADNWAQVIAWATPESPESVNRITGGSVPESGTHSKQSLPDAVRALIRALRPVPPGA